MSAPIPSRSGAPAPEREQAVRYSLVMGLVNFFPRLVAAWLADSATLYTDALRSGTETLANLFSWLTVRRLARGGRADFEYGLGKLENLTSVLIVGAMAVSVVIMAANSIHRLLHPAPLRRLGLGIVVVVLAGIINYILWQKSRQAARAEPSPLMESHWRLMRNKFLANACVLAVLLADLASHGHALALYLDPLASLGLCVFIVFSNYGILADSVAALLDKTLDERLQIEILKHLVVFEPHYRQLHGVRSRRSGKDIFIEIYLEFEGDRRMAEIQDTADAMRAALEQAIPGSHAAIVPTRRTPA